MAYLQWLWTLSNANNGVVLLGVCPALNAWADQTSDFPEGSKPPVQFPFPSSCVSTNQTSGKQSSTWTVKALNTGLCVRENPRSPPTQGLLLKNGSTTRCVNYGCWTICSTTKHFNKKATRLWQFDAAKPPHRPTNTTDKHFVKDLFKYHLSQRGKYIED